MQKTSHLLKIEQKTNAFIKTQISSTDRVCYWKGTFWNFMLVKFLIKLGIMLLCSA